MCETTELHGRGFMLIETVGGALSIHRPFRKFVIANLKQLIRISI
jgi:hypothetical protein